jgi:hypothetical protein
MWTLSAVTRHTKQGIHLISSVVESDAVFHTAVKKRKASPLLREMQRDMSWQWQQAQHRFNVRKAMKWTGIELVWRKTGVSLVYRSDYKEGCTINNACGGVTLVGILPSVILSSCSSHSVLELILILLLFKANPSNSLRIPHLIL